MQDHERPLAERGRDDARQLGLYLQEHHFIPNHILCSSSVRTRQTLSAMAESIIPLPETTFSDKFYLASAGEIYAQLNKLPDNVNAAMVIGHNPGLHEFCITCCAEGDASAMDAISIKFPTSALAVIDLPLAHWEALEPGTGKLRAYLDRHEVARLAS